MDFRIGDCLDELTSQASDSSTEVADKFINLFSLVFVEKVLPNLIIRVHQVIINGFPVANNFGRPLRKHWNCRIWVKVYEWRFEILLLQCIHRDEFNVSFGNVSDRKQRPCVLAKIVSPNFKFIQPWW